MLRRRAVSLVLALFAAPAAGAEERSQAPADARAPAPEPRQPTATAPAVAPLAAERSVAASPELGAQLPPGDPPAPRPEPPDPPPSPSDSVPEVTPPTRPAEAPSRLVRKEYETPALDQADGAPDTRRLRVFDFGLELDLGVNQRLGGATTFDEQERLDVAYGLGFWFTLSDAVALGLELEHTGLGVARDQTGVDVVSAEYSATSASLSGRLVPFRTRDVEGFVALRVGLALGHVEADGVRTASSPFEPPRAFSCAETDGPDLAFGAGLGAALGLGERLRLLARLDADGQRLSSEPLGNCAVGVGSVASVSLGLGLVYGFDAGRADPAAL